MAGVSSPVKELLRIVPFDVNRRRDLADDAVFSMQRRLPTNGITLTMTNDWNDQTHLAENTRMDISLPADFPAQYHKAALRAAGMCTVKRHLNNPPAFDLRIRNGHPD